MRKIAVLDVTDTRRPERVPPPHDQQARRSVTTQNAALMAARAEGLRLEADPYNVLVLNYTMKCPLQCDFCCYACNPSRKETMDLRLALNLVDQAADLGVFRQAGFTGGEPLLFEDEIVTVAERLRRHGMPFSMISSCHWATDEQRTARTVGRLVDLGMCVLSISHDPSHGQFVPPENVRRAVSHVIARGVPVVVCASFYDAEQHLADTFPEYVDHPCVELVDRVVLPVGKSTKRGLTPASYGLSQNVAGFACYKRIYHDVTVFWDGSVYPCCSVYNRSSKGLVLGNAYEDTLATIWDRVEGSLMYRVMKQRGFAVLYDIVAEIDPALHALLPDPELALGPCQLCHQIFSDRSLAAGVSATFDTYEKQRIAEVLDAVVEITEQESAARLLDHITTG